MSKAVKQMQMDALKTSFGDVKDMVVLNITGLNAIADNQFRHALRKKKVRLLQVKNSLARLTFKELGMEIPADSPYWAGSTTLAWGGTSIAELCRNIDEELKGAKTAALYKDKVKIKGAIAEGQTVPFDIAIKMPTRLEAIARVIGLALAPASRLAAQITAPGANLASQIKTVSEKQEEGGAAAPAPETPAPETPAAT